MLWALLGACRTGFILPGDVDLLWVGSLLLEGWESHSGWADVTDLCGISLGIWFL